MKLQAIGQRALKQTILAAFLLGSVNAAHAALALTISPIVGDSSHFSFAGSGSGNVIATGFHNGLLVIPTESITGSLGFGTGLTYGGADVAQVFTQGGNVITLQLGEVISSGSAYSFDDSVGTYSMGGAYGTVFTPGVYAITNSTNMFGDGATGTLTIMPALVPEPSSFAIIAGVGALAFACMRRRKTC